MTKSLTTHEKTNGQSTWIRWGSDFAIIERVGGVVTVGDSVAAQMGSGEIESWDFGPDAETADRVYHETVSAYWRMVAGVAA